MVIDGETAALIGVLSGIASSFVGYGVMKEKIRQLERDNDRQEDKYVRLSTYNAVIPPLQEAVFEIERDIKKILQLLSKANLRKEDE